METRIALVSPCFEIENNRFLTIEANSPVNFDTDQDIIKLAPQTTCNQIIVSNFFLDNDLRILLRAYFSQHSLARL